MTPCEINKVEKSNVVRNRTYELDETLEETLFADANLGPDASSLARLPCCSEHTTRVSVASDGTEANSISDNPATSADGRYVAFESYATNLASGDFDWISDIFVHDTQTGDTVRVSQAADGREGNGHSYDP